MRQFAVFAAQFADFVVTLQLSIAAIESCCYLSPVFRFRRAKAVVGLVRKPGAFAFALAAEEAENRIGIYLPMAVGAKHRW